MRNYINYLYKHVEQVNKEKEQARLQKAASLQTVLQPVVKSLERQLIELVRTLSTDQLKRPWTMDEFVIRLDGVWRDRPHPQQVGEILRKLGWQRRRVYGVGAGRRYWFPPP